MFRESDIFKPYEDDEPPIVIELGPQASVDKYGNFSVLFVGSGSSGLTPGMQHCCNIV